MRRSWLPLILILLLIGLIPLGNSFAQPGLPASAVYLPIVFRSLPTVTSTLSPTATPQPTIPPVTSVCAQNAPAAHEGAQAWMMVQSPSRRSFTTLCVRLIVRGQVVVGASASGTAHYKTTDTSFDLGATDDEGVAAVTFNVGGASSGYTVAVDAQVRSSGKIYRASTSFTPE